VSGRGDGLVRSNPLAEEVSNWRRFLTTEEEAALEAIRHHGRTGRPWGEESWTVATARRLGLDFTLHPRGRPRKEAKK